ARLGALEVSVEPMDPLPQDLAALGQRVLGSAPVRQALGTARHRLLAVDLLDDDLQQKDGRSAGSPTSFRATIYDYSNDRTLFARAPPDAPLHLQLGEPRRQPLPSAEEFEEAVAVLTRDPALGPAIRGGGITPYPAMPPIVGDELPDGRRRRRLGVGLLP